MTTTTGTLGHIDHDQAEHARDLVNGALKRSGLARAELRAVLQAGFVPARYNSSEHPSLWASATPHDRAVSTAGRLLLRLHHELHLPLESLQGPSALSIAEELLT